MEETKKIMIVDDEPHVIRSLDFIFSREGYTVTKAEDGEKAIDLMKKSKPDLMFLDVMMPKKNGYEVCQEIRSDPGLKDIYIIILTAKGREADRQKGISSGANEVITKPFSPVEVVEQVKRLFD
jgi:CheY-like chemotaxis protein